MTATGEQFVMMRGTSERLRWCAEPWTVEQLGQSKSVPTLAKAKETSGWTILIALVMRRPFGTANDLHLEKTTVAIVKMLGWCVQVKS